MATIEAEAVHDEERRDLIASEPAEKMPATYGNNALDIEPAQFKAALDRRKDNRTALMEWVQSALVDGTDYGRIHVIKKSECPKGKYCDNPRHFSKPSLFKPGAEKICGMLGVTVVYPNIRAYEDIAIEGRKVNDIVLRCHLIGADGRILGEGIGARSVSEDSGDLNKALKMASKSAQIDATLRMAGLSEIFTQDIEDMKLGEQGDFKPTNGSQAPAGEWKHDPDSFVGIGKHKETAWKDVDDGYLTWVIDNITNKPDIVRHAKAEIELRIRASEAETGQTSMPLDSEAENGVPGPREHPGPRPSPDEQRGAATLAKAIGEARDLGELDGAYNSGTERAKQAVSAYYERRRKDLGG